MDVREILIQLRAGASNRQISRDMGIARQTAQRYRHWAETHGLLAGAMPDLETLRSLLVKTLPEKSPPQNTSSVENYRSVVEPLVKAEVETTAIWERLKERGPNLGNAAPTPLTCRQKSCPVYCSIGKPACKKPALSAPERSRSSKIFSPSRSWNACLPLDGCYACAIALATSGWKPPASAP